MTMVEFLRARLNEDERAAREARGKRWHIGNAVDPTKSCNVHEFPTVRLIADNCGWLEAEHIARWNPERVLVEIETKRQILERAVTEIENQDPPRATALYASIDLMLLVRSYAWHPEFDEAWRT